MLIYKICDGRLEWLASDLPADFSLAKLEWVSINRDHLMVRFGVDCRTAARLGGENFRKIKDLSPAVCAAFCNAVNARRSEKDDPTFRYCNNVWEADNLI